MEVDRRWSYWQENGQFYDLYKGDQLVGWTFDTLAAVTWVIHGTPSPDIDFIRRWDGASYDKLVQHTLDREGL